MNTAKVQQIINQLIEEKQKQIRYARQYAPAKKQIAKLEELGILNLMPAKFGHTDADVVIAAATNAKTAVMNAYGEGEELSASDLYAAINENRMKINNQYEQMIADLSQLSFRPLPDGDKVTGKQLDEDGYRLAIITVPLVGDDEVLAEDEDGVRMEKDYLGDRYIYEMDFVRKTSIGGRQLVKPSRTVYILSKLTDEEIEEKKQKEADFWNNGD